METSKRVLKGLIQSVHASDGAGVKLLRSLGQRPNLRVDPFLMLDAFGTDNPDDYIAGFPDHPHRGFETVTYMLDGHMLHQDHMGNRGDLRGGDVQWMTAGRGIIHSETPQQTEGRMRGFQLWINLPAAEKMKPAHYRDIPSGDIPVASLPSGGSVKVIAGRLSLGTVDWQGPGGGGFTNALYLDVALGAGERVTVPTVPDYNAFVYSYEGDVSVGPDTQHIPLHAAGVLGPGQDIDLIAAEAGARVLVLAARPINEPILQYGPFVMNTREEIEQAIHDYQNGELAVASR